MKGAKQLILLGFFFLTINISMAQTYAVSIDSIIQQINVERYRNHFDSIPALPYSNRKVLPILGQSADHNQCRDYIFRTFQKLLGKENCYLHFFESGSSGGLANVIGIKKGSNSAKGIWIIGAHYDSNNSNQKNQELTVISPGANDNGTGIAALLELAGIVSTIETEATILFAAWDFEEVFTDGFATGSNAWFNQFVKKKKETDWHQPGLQGNINIDNIRGNINFDMFGHPQIMEDDKPVLWACYAKENQKSFTEQYALVFNKYVPDILAKSHGVLIWSDHNTFAANKIPSVENLESDYQKDPYYHTYSDNINNPDNIDFEFATNVTRGGLAFLLEQTLKKNLDITACINKQFIKAENPNYYCFQAPSESGTFIIYNKTGQIVASASNVSVFYFTPPLTDWYYIRFSTEQQGWKQVVTMQKKEGLFEIPLSY